MYVLDLDYDEIVIVIDGVEVASTAHTSDEE